MMDLALVFQGVKGVECSHEMMIPYFMHVRYASRLIWGFSIAGFVRLALFFVLTLPDYETRIPVQGG